MPVSLPEGEVGVSVSFRTISLPFEAIRAEYLSRTQWLRKGRPSCPFCTRYKLAPWPKTYDRYVYNWGEPERAHTDKFRFCRVYIYILGRCLQHRGGEPEQAKGADGMQLFALDCIAHIVDAEMDRVFACMNDM